MVKCYALRMTQICSSILRVMVLCAINCVCVHVRAHAWVHEVFCMKFICLILYLECYKYHLYGDLCETDCVAVGTLSVSIYFTSHGEMCTETLANYLGSTYNTFF
jgi:carbon starvation protein CstA